MPMETRHDLEHTTERLTEVSRCPWKWGQCRYVGAPLLCCVAMSALLCCAVSVCRCSSAVLCRCVGAPLLCCVGMSVLLCCAVSLCRCSSAVLCRYVGAPLLTCVGILSRSDGDVELATGYSDGRQKDRDADTTAGSRRRSSKR